MNPIINPFWIYLINVCDNVGTVFSVLAILSGFALAVLLIVTGAIAYESGIDNYEYKQMVKWMKSAIVSSIILIVGVVFTPSSKTVTAMVVADLTTPNNITTVAEAGKDVVDYLIDTIQEITGDNEENESPDENK